MFTWRLDIPTAAIIPNITRNMPPITGSGMVIKTAPNFPKIPRTIIRMPVVWMTNLLPTWYKMSTSTCYPEHTGWINMVHSYHARINLTKTEKDTEF